MIDTIGFVTACNSWTNVCVRARACLCVFMTFLLKYECVWRGVLYPCIHVCSSACHTGQRVAVQEKGLSSGGECSPLTPSVTGPKHRNSPFGGFWLCVYVCVCTVRVRPSEGSCARSDAAWCQVTRRELRSIDEPWQRITQSERVWQVCIHVWCDQIRFVGAAGMLYLGYHLEPLRQTRETGRQNITDTKGVKTRGRW